MNVAMILVHVVVGSYAFVTSVMFHALKELIQTDSLGGKYSAPPTSDS